MRKIAAFIGSVILITAFTSKKERTFIPPGTVRINDTLFADVTEISNLSWKEFEVYQKNKYGADSFEHLASFPDTTVWKSSMTYNEPYVNMYYWHPAFNDYPVVGISYEQAQAYCKWRTDMVHIFLEIKEGKRKAEDRYKPYSGAYKFAYRLPTRREWEALAFIGVDDKKKTKYNKVNKREAPLYNALDTSDVLFDCSMATAYVKAYLPNKMGLYNMIGNVSEMMIEKGIAKGGNWLTKREELNIWKDEKFDKANAITGLRCVCVIK